MGRKSAAGLAGQRVGAVLLPLADGVRRPEAGPGEAAEGFEVLPRTSGRMRGSGRRCRTWRSRRWSWRVRRTES